MRRRRFTDDQRELVTMAQSRDDWCVAADSFAGILSFA